LVDEAKRKSLIFLLMVLILTLMIGVGLPRLRFQPGMPLPSLSNDGQVFAIPSEGAPPVGVKVNTLLFISLLILLGGYLLIQIYRLVKGFNWKKLLSQAFSFLFTLLVIFGVLSLVINLLPESQVEVYAEPILEPQPAMTAPLGPVPPLLVWLAALGLAGCAVVLGIWLVSSKRRPAVNLWELEAEKARQAILAGQDLKNVILGCYRRMSLALQEDQMIQREAFMTSKEFERLLTIKGVPHEPVHQLTQLFESVRYGHWQPDPSDERRAIQCLEAILDYSYAARQGSRSQNSL
jgi:hypothetical protein